MKRIHLLACSILLASARAGWIDPDSPRHAHSTRAHTEGDDRDYQLVFSDEFEQDGRTFRDGSDPRWTAINKNDYTNDALHFYSHDNVQTINGVLNITTEQKEKRYTAFNEKTKKFYADKKYIQSGMVQGWNKFCFTGGIIEFRAKLPGDPKIGGLWPALWMLGNLARATYVGSTDYVWPFSYNKCDQRTRKSQAITACSRVNHYGLASYEGRGSPEIDILEGMQGDITEELPNTRIRRPYQSASLQVAPGIEIDRPILGHRPHKANWYQHLEYGDKNMTDLNPFFYGVTLVHSPKTRTYQSDAISANRQLNLTHYKQHHVYRVEWQPPVNGSDGYLKWFTDGLLVSAIYSDSLTIMGTEIPTEPMYLIMNTAVASSWGFPLPCPDNCDCKCYECGNPTCACALPPGYCDNFPASFEIDYVRVFQANNDSSQILGCSPVHRPTAQYIEGHKKRFVSEGQTEPLLPIVSGGGGCSDVDDCGGPERGSCSSHGVCSCNDGWTGPHCRSHAAFYDTISSSPVKKFSLSNMMVPRSLIVLLGLMIVGFFSSMVGTVRRLAQDSGYQKLPTAGGEGGTPLVVSPRTASYQHSSSADQYALPAKGKEVTYCVIDGRLVDS